MAHLIRQMGHVAMAAPDPELAARDLVEVVGLRSTEQDGDTCYLSSGRRHHEISFHRGARAEVLAIGLEAMDAAAVDEVMRRVRSDGLQVLDDRPLGPHIERALRFVTPFGAVFEVHTPVARNQAQYYIGPGARPKRIDHANLKAPDTRVVTEFMTGTLGMRLSDETSGGEFAWFRAWDGYHHTVAVFVGPPALHHYGFDFHSIEDLAAVAESLVLRDRMLLWGPGRHAAGGNVFAYYVDPNDCVVEGSVHMDRIDNDELWEHRTWPFTPDLKGRWINQWGAPPPETFVSHGLPFAAGA